MRGLSRLRARTRAADAAFRQSRRARRETAQRAARDAFRDKAKAYTEYMSVNVDGLRYLVATTDDNVGRTLFVKGARMEMRLLERALKVTGQTPAACAKRTFVDVGANIGTTTLAAVGRHGFREAIAIEPEPQNASILRAAAALNRLEQRIRVIEAAASSRPGSASLRVDLTQSGMHEIISGQTDAGHHIQVPTITLDGLVEAGVFDPDTVGLLWMDVQYHEGPVLQGASEILQRGIPIVAEYSGLRESPGFWDAACEAYTHVAPIKRKTLEPIPIREARDALARTLETDLLLYRT